MSQRSDDQTRRYYGTETRRTEYKVRPAKKVPTFTLRIRTENDAFGETFEHRQAEVTRIVRDALHSIELGNASGVLRDINGNTVGHFGFEDSE